MSQKTPSFILELPLKISSKEEKELLSRLESARLIYNAVLVEAKRRVLLIRQSKVFNKAKKLPKSNEERNLLFKEAKDNFEFNEYSLHKYAGELRRNLINNLDIQTVQKLASRAFHAVEKILYGMAKKVRFKGYNQFNSVESKSNETGILWRDNEIKWKKLVLRPIINSKDEVINYGLKQRVKYCRIVRKVIRNKNRFYVQLVLEGKPFIKEKNSLGKGIVSFDFGPSTVAIVAKNDNNKYQAKLLQFCSELENKEKETKRLQRKIDRQKRKNNADNYNANGTIKKGRRYWNKSNRQRNNSNQLKELYRTIKEHRKSLHGQLINETLKMGNIFKTENISGKWLQKLYGKSVGSRGPKIFVSGIERKAVSAGGLFIEFPTITTKLSQSCCCGQNHKKKLSERVHNCECGIIAQRDLFSAFLGIFVEKEDKKDGKYLLHADQSLKEWSSADKPLQTAWRESVESTNGRHVPTSFGKPLAIWSQSGSFAKEERAELNIQDVVEVLLKEQREPERELYVFSLKHTWF